MLRKSKARTYTAGKHLVNAIPHWYVFSVEKQAELDKRLTQVEQEVEEIASPQRRVKGNVFKDVLK